MLTLPLFFAATAAGAGEKPKNVVLIMVDDLRPTLGCMGDSYAVTPFLDDFASESYIYRSAYCQQALSGPTRASMLTGLYPDQTGVTELNTLMRERIPDVKTLPQVFRENGYATYGIGKIFHGDENSEDAASWSEAPLLYHYTKNDEYLLPEHRTGKKSVAYEFTDEDPEGYWDVKVRNAALARISELKGSTVPFFLAVGFLKPHLPFCAPERFMDIYEDRPNLIDTSRVVGAPAIAYHDNEELRGYTDIPSVGPMTLEQQETLRKAYYACTSYTDDNVGAVLAALKEAGLYEDCVIVFVGDHGFHLGEQGLWCKSTNFHPACNAPLIIHDAGQDRGKVRNDFVEFIDIMPTVCSLAGIKAPSGLPGKDIFRGNGRDCAVSQFVRPYGTITKPALKTHTGYVIRTARWTYVEWTALDGEVTDRELYRTAEDRVEKVNLAGKPIFRRKMGSLSKKMHGIYAGK